MKGDRPIGAAGTFDQTVEREGGGTLLLVEDNPTTAKLTIRVLEEADLVDEVHVASDGVEALEMLEEGGEPGPDADLVLLDIGLPRMDGHEVLHALREQMGYGSLPVLVISSSGDRRDVELAYDLGANGYVQKPTGVEGLRDLAEGIESFWLRSALLPGDAEA